jgi:hypothetical protein
MIDRLLKSPQFNPRTLWELVSRLPVIDISNVFHYCIQHNLNIPGKQRNSFVDSLTLIPPFQECWMEGKTSHPEVSTLGVQLKFDTGAAGLGPTPKNVGLSPEPDHLLKGEIIVELRGARYLAAHRFTIPMTQDGTQCRVVDNGNFLGPALLVHKAMDVACSAEIDELAQDFIDAVCLALTFMHCKNVTVVDNCPAKPLQKKHLRTSRYPLFTYKTIKIEPAKEVLRSVGNVAENGLAKALHICRGHFKVFDEHPLFGKIQGKFWWPSHVRGSESAGVAVRDYRVNPQHKGCKPHAEAVSPINNALNKETDENK